MTPTRCAICAGALALRLRRVLAPGTDRAFSILRCKVCGLGHTSPCPDDLHAFYTREYYGGRHGVTESLCIRRRMRWVGEATRGNRGVLVDIGCGDGAFLLAARREGWTVAGTEIGRAAELARGAGLHVEDALEDLSRLAPIRCATLWHTLEHFSDPRATLEKLASMLAPEGVLLVAVPNSRGVQARFFGSGWFHLDVPRHLFHFSRTSLARALDLSGFVVDRWRHMEFEYDVLGWIQSGLNAFMPKPNLLFDVLRGRPTALTTTLLASNWGAAAGCAPLAIAGTLAEAAIGSGGTLIAVARRGSMNRAVRDGART